MADLTGSVVVVTGGASGLGEAAAHRLADDGARVIVADIDEVGAQRVASAITADNGWAKVCAVDVTNDAEVRALAALAADSGDVRGLVLSAAVETRVNLVDCDDESWQRVIDVNLKGPFLCMKHLIPLMVQAGGGSVVALGSVLGSMASPQYSAYTASKGALVNLCKQAAIEHAPDGVRVNVIAPSACEAGLFMQVTAAAPDPDAVRRMVAERTPMGRLGTADDVCETIMFLLGEGSSYISGTVIPLDGGLAARRQ